MQRASDRKNRWKSFQVIGKSTFRRGFSSGLRRGKQSGCCATRPKASALLAEAGHEDGVRMYA